MGPQRRVSPTRDTAIGLEEFKGDTVGTVWATTLTAAKQPTPTRLLKETPERWSRLRTAAFGGKLDEVEKLSNGCAKAELDAPDKAGWTALMYAARGGHLDIARLLLQRGASVNVTNSKGWTALMFASWLPTPNEPLVRCLMQAGADASARNNAGLSCADEARSQQNEAIADLLDAQSGANPQAVHARKVAATPPRSSPARSSHRTSWRGPERAAPGRPTTMGVDQRLRSLDNVPFLKPLTGGERRRLARVVEVRSYAAGEVIVRQGDEGSSMFILMSGSAEASVEGVGVVQAYGSRDSFGELALLTSERRGATIVTTSAEAVCACLHRKQFEMLVGKLGKCLSELRRRLRANAYFDGKTDYERLFRYYDRDNSGLLDWEQFRSAVRRDGQVTTRAVSERQLRILFDLIDLDGNGSLRQKEFVLFISSSAHGATAWVPKHRPHRSNTAHGGEVDEPAQLVHARVSSGNLTEQQQQEKHRRELAQREQEQKQWLRKKEWGSSQTIAAAADRANAETTPHMRRQPSGSAWRDVPASESRTPRSSPPEGDLDKTTHSASQVSPPPCPRTAQTPPDQPAVLSPEDDVDPDVTASTEGSAKQRRASDEALWTPRSVQERRVTVNLRHRATQLEKDNARLQKELQESRSARAIGKQEAAAMVLRLRQATKDLERERARADDEGRARAICEGERDAATKMARAATDKLAEIERGQQRHHSSAKDHPDRPRTDELAEKQLGERARTHSPRQLQEERHCQPEPCSSRTSVATGPEWQVLNVQLETERAALRAAEDALLESEEKHKLAWHDSSASDHEEASTSTQPRFAEGDTRQVAASMRRSLSPQPEKGNLSSPVQSLEELEQQWVTSAQQRQRLASTHDTPAPILASAEGDEPGLIEVVCPMGVASGDWLTVEIDDEGGTLEVQVPSGINPGDAFLVDERTQLGSLGTSVDESTAAAAAAALEAAEQRADESERQLSEVMAQVAAALQRRKEDAAKLKQMELALAAEKEGRAGDQAGLNAYLDSAADLKQSLAEEERRATQCVQELESIRAELESSEAELQRERLAHSDTKAEMERLMERARNNAADVAKASESASAALLAELRMEQNARSAAEDEVQTLRAELTAAQEASADVAVLQARVEQEQESAAELLKALELAEEKMSQVVEETASAIMSARAEEAALAVVNARRDMAAENEESVTKAVMDERSRLEAIQEAASQQATAKIAELKRVVEAQALQEKQAVTLWEGQEAALVRQLEEAEHDLAEVTQAYPLALEEAKSSLAAAHELELQALRDEPQPEPENTMYVNELLAEIKELKLAAETQMQQEKAAVALWEKQEALLAKQLEEAQCSLKATDETRAELESRSTAAVQEIAQLKAQVAAQTVQEKEAVTLWEEQEAALMRQLEEAESDLAELTQAYPLALEEAKASLAQAHAHEMEVATGVSALVSAEPAPVAELADEGRIDELRTELREKQVEIEELYEIHEQRSQQVSALEQDVLHVGRQLSEAKTLNEALQAELTERRTSNTAVNATVESELRAELNEARAENEMLQVQLTSLNEQYDSWNVEKLKTDLLKQGEEIKTAEDAHRKSLHSVLAAHVAELEALKEAHAVEVAAARNEAMKKSETAQTALRKVRTMLTPVKANPAGATKNATSATVKSVSPQETGRKDDSTAALEEREAAALQQVEELRARLEHMEKMQLRRPFGVDGDGFVARSRSNEMAHTVRAMLSGVDVATPVRGTGAEVAPSAEQLQDEYLTRAVLAAEIARSNTPNTAKQKQQELLGSVGCGSTPVGIVIPRLDDRESTAERRRREAEIRSTLKAGMISPAEAEKMLLHHQLEASLTPAKDNTAHGPSREDGSLSVDGSRWDQLAHKLDDALTDAQLALPSDTEHADDDANAVESNPFEAESGMLGMELESSAPGEAEIDSDPFKTSSDEDERPLSPVPERGESPGMLSPDTAGSCEEDTEEIVGKDDAVATTRMEISNARDNSNIRRQLVLPVDEQLDPFEETATSELLSSNDMETADATDPFRTWSDEDSRLNILTPVLEDDAGEVGSHSDLSQQSVASLLEERSRYGSDSPASDGNNAAAEKVRLVKSMQASLDEHSPIPPSAYVTESLVERMKVASARASSAPTAGALPYQQHVSTQGQLPRASNGASMKFSMSSVLDGSSDESLSESESDSTEDEPVGVEVEPDV